MPARAIFIVDTNVVVAGLLAAVPSSPVARVLDGMLAAAFPHAVSEALLGEYRTVLLRPAVRKLHSMSVDDVERLLVDLVQQAIVLQPAELAEPAGSKMGRPLAPAPGDQFLWDLLACRPDLVLITGDRRLLADEGMQGRVTSARAFVDAL
ncbi:MAG: PIN domain-containing protein [Burkholderiaceae bacterium]|nr:PIN domain-containing protein [Burkholderiaceae bacterium]